MKLGGNGNTTEQIQPAMGGTGTPVSSWAPVPGAASGAPALPKPAVQTKNLVPYLEGAAGRSSTNRTYRSRRLTPDQLNQREHRELLEYLKRNNFKIPGDVIEYDKKTDYRHIRHIYEEAVKQKQDAEISKLAEEYRQKEDPTKDFNFSIASREAAKKAGLEDKWMIEMKRRQRDSEASQRAETEKYIRQRQVDLGDPSISHDRVTGSYPNGLRTMRRKEIVDAKVREWQREREADPTGKNLPPARYGSTRYYEEQHAQRMRQEFEFQDNRKASADRWYGQIREKMSKPESYEAGVNELVEFRRMNPNYVPKPGHPAPQFATVKTEGSKTQSKRDSNDPIDDQYAKISKLMSDPKTYDEGVKESKKFWNENPMYIPKATSSNGSTSVSNGDAVTPGSNTAPQAACKTETEPPKAVPPAVKQPEPPKAAAQSKRPIPVEQSGFNRNPLPNPKNNPDIKEYNDLLTRIKEEAKTRRWPDAEVLPDGTIHLHEGSSNVHNSNSNVDPIPYAPGHYGFGGFGPKTAKPFVIDYYLRPDGTLQVIKTGVNDRWNLKSKEWRFEIQGNKLDRQEIVTPKGTNPPYVEHHRSSVIPIAPQPQEQPAQPDSDRFEPSSNLLLA